VSKYKNKCYRRRYYHHNDILETYTVSTSLGTADVPAIYDLTTIIRSYDNLGVEISEPRPEH